MDSTLASARRPGWKASCQSHIQYLVGHLQAGETLHVLGPWCGPEVPPSVTVRAEIEYDPVHITIRPL